jgi:capsular polysaccharide biosynthesis protein
MKKLQLIVFSTLLLGAAAFLYASLLPSQYSSEVALAVIQEKRANNLLLGTEELTQVFAQIIYMEPFIDGVLEAPYELEGVFPNLVSPVAKKEAWRDHVKVDINPETGIITIKALDETQQGAENLAQALNWNLTKKAQIYYNNQTNFRIEKLEGPVTSSIPTEPDVLEYFLWGAGGGFVLGIFLVLLGIPASSERGDYSKKNREAKLKVRKKLQEQLDKRENSFTQGETVYSFRDRASANNLVKEKNDQGERRGRSEVRGEEANYFTKEARVAALPTGNSETKLPEALTSQASLPENPTEKEDSSSPLSSASTSTASTTVAPEEGIFTSPEEFMGEEEVPGKPQDVNSKLYGKSLLADQEQAELEERRKFPERFDEQGKRKETSEESKTQFFPGFASTKLAKEKKDQQSKEKSQKKRLRLKAVWKDGSYSEVVNGGGIESEKVELEDKEPTEAEIKERLNRLLRGEMHQE